MKSLGKLIYHYYFRPVNSFRESWRHGGPWTLRETNRQRAAMEAAAATLPALNLPAAPDHWVLHLMTGKRFWYQTAFCIHSFARHSGVAVAIEIYDDGTLAGSDRTALARLGLPITFHDSLKLKENLERHLPRERYPILRERWDNYPNIRKLIDVHLASSGWKLVIDSDLLFFRRPEFLLSWMNNPNCPLYAIDCTESYGYSRNLMKELTGVSIPPLVNVGLCGLRSNDLDWDELESWCRTLIEREKTSYYLEQALVAMLASRQTCAVAAQTDYITRPEPDEISAPTAVMHHYVDTAKRGYFRTAWHHVLNS